ncbi:hypothetical protein BUE93_03830 [Chromobacterium amazonense]|uniref:Uncharacterized protein n=1 Tax=Chromobacterium amazonense TaxID=1382803 RepID=A0A2S9X8I3_9NEIS|nr:hypothetical protein BUE93_03830 [Chromobacterium amazonense]
MTETSGHLTVRILMPAYQSDCICQKYHLLVRKPISYIIIWRFKCRSLCIIQYYYSKVCSLVAGQLVSANPNKLALGMRNYYHWLPELESTHMNLILV